MPNLDVPFRGRWIWKLKTLPRIQFFVWPCMHHSIGVRECLLARGTAIENSCSICLNGPESIVHALRDCPSAKAIWHQFGVLPSNPVFFLWRILRSGWFIIAMLSRVTGQVRSSVVVSGVFVLNKEDLKK